jgi:hypothetical protein
MNLIVMIVAAVIPAIFNKSLSFLMVEDIVFLPCSLLQDYQHIARFTGIASSSNIRDR